MPIAFSSSPVIFALVYASFGVRPAPRAWLPGNWVNGAGMRLTIAPCSWSVAMVTGIGTRCLMAACWMPFDRCATCAGLVTFGGSTE
jgi:hypothetical protein